MASISMPKRRSRQQDQRNNYYQRDIRVEEPEKNCGCCQFNCWSCFAHVVTCWAPAFLLKCCGMKEKEIRQAFREKIALCFIILIMCLLLGFLTFGLGFLLCPKHDSRPRIPIKELRLSPDGKRTWMQGYVFDAKEVSKALNVPQEDIANRDSGYRFPPSVDFCRGVFKSSYVPQCRKEDSCLDRNQLYFMVNPFKKVVYNWDEVQGKNSNYIVYDGEVWDLTELMMANDNWLANEEIGNDVLRHLGKDVSAAMARRGSTGRRTAECLSSWFKVGDLSTQTMGCVAYNIIVALSMFAVVALILTKFFMAVTFSWFLSRKLDRMQKNQEGEFEEGQLIRQEVPEIVTQSIQATLGVNCVLGMSSKTKIASNRPFVILMVTCYSESEASIKSTLDSLAATDYPDQRKLLFIVADGLVTGSGNWASTPEIILKMLNIDESMGDPKVFTYSAVSEGPTGINMAKVFVGVYGYEGRSIPVVLVVKCGLPSEESNRKPGNRGKRDSQMILMNFLQRVIFNESMTALDYDLFNKIYWLMGVPPDYFDIVLMVDADTRVAVDSLGRMVNAMMRDPKVIGLCGETKIANKGQSWVTAIQVFEYYISHHLGKAFESVFGGVTCLPGCFSMYRIKVAKNGQWVPILVSPAVTEEYSQKTVDTLHKKNLLLLGEDRFLTTLMIRTFPKRKMIFVPQAYCKTIVPHEFKVLLSQRRRWINSTIHNLMELVLVNDLCGTFCFSMQFVVLMELIGNVVLPAAIIFTGALLATAFVNPLNAILPLALLVLVLGLPAVLIVITTKNLIYLLWMVIYLLALPIWNFVLPLYAYWHFDDFTWGHTRRLSDKEETKEEGELDAEDLDGPVEVKMKTWIAWTRYHLKQYNEKEKASLE